jgi:NADPH-dependent ferric siderophore reductase
MAKNNLKEFYELVAEGDTVQLVGRRNEQTAQLFGDVQAQPAAAAAQPVMTASTEPSVTVQAPDAGGTASTLPADGAVLAIAALR